MHVFQRFELFCRGLISFNGKRGLQNAQYATRYYAKRKDALPSSISDDRFLTPFWRGRSLIMKTKSMNSIVLLSMAFAVMPAIAADLRAGNTTFVQAQGKTMQMANPFTKPDALKNENTGIEHFGNLSSQPWTQIVGWHNGQPASMRDEKSQEPKLHLIWFGADPQTYN